MHNSLWILYHLNPSQWHALPYFSYIDSYLFMPNWEIADVTSLYQDWIYAAWKTRIVLFPAIWRVWKDKRFSRTIRANRWWHSTWIVLTALMPPILFDLYFRFMSARVKELHDDWTPKKDKYDPPQAKGRGYPIIIIPGRPICGVNHLKSWFRPW